MVKSIWLWSIDEAVESLVGSVLWAWLVQPWERVTEPGALTHNEGPAHQPKCTIRENSNTHHRKWKQSLTLYPTDKKKVIIFILRFQYECK